MNKILKNKMIFFKSVRHQNVITSLDVKKCVCLFEPARNRDNFLLFYRSCIFSYQNSLTSQNNSQNYNPPKIDTKSLLWISKLIKIIMIQRNGLSLALQYHTMTLHAGGIEIILWQKIPFIFSVEK